MGSPTNSKKTGCTAAARSAARAQPANFTPGEARGTNGDVHHACPQGLHTFARKRDLKDNVSGAAIYTATVFGGTRYQKLIEAPLTICGKTVTALMGPEDEPILFIPTFVGDPGELGFVLTFEDGVIAEPRQAPNTRPEGDRRPRHPRRVPDSGPRLRPSAGTAKSGDPRYPAGVVDSYARPGDDA